MATPTNDYYVEITERDDSPDNWPFRKVEINVTASDDEEAEAIAERLLAAIRKEWHTEHVAMELNEVYEI
jgi:hypothetical protein